MKTKQVYLDILKKCGFSKEILRQIILLSLEIKNAFCTCQRIYKSGSNGFPYRNVSTHIIPTSSLLSNLKFPKLKSCLFITPNYRKLALIAIYLLILHKQVS